MAELPETYFVTRAKFRIQVMDTNGKANRFYANKYIHKDEELIVYDINQTIYHFVLKNVVSFSIRTISPKEEGNSDEKA